MKFSTSSEAKWFLLRLAFFLVFPLQNAVCESEGIVNATIEWGSSKQSFTYVFSGVVTCEKRPCTNARVELDLVSATEGVISHSTQVSEDGRYQIEVKLEGAPDNSSTWKLAARTSGLSERQSAEAEGRVILVEGQNTVVVERPLYLIQA